MLHLSPVEILLVEDNPGDIRLLQEAFKEGGLTCRLNITRDGEQAMAYLHQEGPYTQSPRPALILLDLNMPRMDGRELLAEIKSEREFSRIPVMILSTSTDQEDIQKAYELHANCYLPKPSDLDSLVQLSKVIEGFWLNAALLPV
ncbi:MAG TPA: response regulator [Bryobacteraceae bacterium]|nr:response regulator [Bryobacteraceae bacterium]